MYLIIMQFLHGRGLHESADTLAKETRLFVSLSHIEALVKSRSWNQIESYLMNFLNISDIQKADPKIQRLILNIRKQIYCEFLFQDDLGSALGLLRYKKYFRPFRSKFPKEVDEISNFLVAPKIDVKLLAGSKDRWILPFVNPDSEVDTKSQESSWMTEIKKCLQNLKLEFSESYQTPGIQPSENPSPRLSVLLNQAISWQHDKYCQGGELAKERVSFLVNHVCPPPPAPANPPPTPAPAPAPANPTPQPQQPPPLVSASEKKRKRDDRPVSANSTIPPLVSANAEPNKRTRLNSTPQANLQPPQNMQPPQIAPPAQISQTPQNLRPPQNPANNLSVIPRQSQDSSVISKLNYQFQIEIDDVPTACAINYYPAEGNRQSPMLVVIIGTNEGMVKMAKILPSQICVNFEPEFVTLPLPINHKPVPITKILFQPNHKNSPPGLAITNPSFCAAREDGAILIYYPTSLISTNIVHGEFKPLDSASILAHTQHINDFMWWYTNSVTGSESKWYVITTGADGYLTVIDAMAGARVNSYLLTTVENGGAKGVLSVVALHTNGVDIVLTTSADAVITAFVLGYEPLSPATTVKTVTGNWWSGLAYAASDGRIWGCGLGSNSFIEWNGLDETVLTCKTGYENYENKTNASLKIKLLHGLDLLMIYDSGQIKFWNIDKPKPTVTLYPGDEFAQPSVVDACVVTKLANSSSTDFDSNLLVVCAGIQNIKVQPVTDDDDEPSEPVKQKKSILKFFGDAISPPSKYYVPPTPSYTGFISKIMYTHSGAGLLAMDDNGTLRYWFKTDQKPLTSAKPPTLKSWPTEGPPGEPKGYYTCILAINTLSGGIPPTPCLSLSKHDRYLMVAAGAEFSVLDLSEMKTMLNAYPTDISQGIYAPSCVVFLPSDNNIMAVGRVNGKVYICENVSSSKIIKICTGGHGNNEKIIDMVFWSHELLLSLGKNGTLCMWRWKYEKTPPKPVPGVPIPIIKPSWIKNVAVNGGGNVVMMSWNDTMRTVTIVQEYQISLLKFPRLSQSLGKPYTSDEEIACPTFFPKPLAQIAPNKKCVGGSWSAKGSYLYLAFEGGTVVILDSSTNVELRRISVNFEIATGCLAISPAFEEQMFVCGKSGGASGSTAIVLEPAPQEEKW